MVFLGRLPTPIAQVIQVQHGRELWKRKLDSTCLDSLSCAIRNSVSVAMESRPREFDPITLTSNSLDEAMGTVMMGQYLLVTSLTSSWCVFFLSPVILPLLLHRVTHHQEFFSIPRRGSRRRSASLVCFDSASFHLLSTVCSKSLFFHKVFPDLWKWNDPT